MRRLLLPLFCLLSLPVLATDAPPVKVGAYYFDGWNPKDSHVSARMKTEFPNREPVWGWFDDTDAVMKQQIDLNADAGISFWSFCWYWPEKGGDDHSLAINNALDLYLKAPNHSRLQFCLLVANHAGYRVGPKQWPSVCPRWIALFKEPTYLTVGGKPLLIIFSPGELLKSFGTTEAVKAALDQLRTEAKAAGLPGVMVGVCAFNSPKPEMEKMRDSGYDLFTGYNYHAPVKPEEANNSKKDKPFSALIAINESTWNGIAKSDVLPYIPLITTGWDRRPWEPAEWPEDKRAFYYPDRTPAQVGQIVEKGIKWVNDNPTKATPERLVILYAWNENGEGGYITPTKAEGSTYLDAVAKAIKSQ